MLATMLYPPTDRDLQKRDHKTKNGSNLRPSRPQVSLLGFTKSEGEPDPFTHSCRVGEKPGSLVARTSLVAKLTTDDLVVVRIGDALTAFPASPGIGAEADPTRCFLLAHAACQPES